jgi:hypothetical protein
MSSDDGAGRKVRRLNQIADKVKSHGAAGIPLSALQVWAERSLGLSAERTSIYISLLERTRELFFDAERRRYYHVESRLKL